MKKCISVILSFCMLFTSFTAVTSYADDTASAKAAVQESTVPVKVKSGGTKKMEYLTRGAIGATIDGNVYLTWRLLGTELTDTTFNIYCNGSFLANVDATNYTHKGGNAGNTYQIAPVINGSVGAFSKEVQIVTGHRDKSAAYGQAPYGYIDVPLNTPPDGKTYSGSSYSYANNTQDQTGGANDASVGDIDGDGEYEIILKWDPNNSKDSSNSGQTGNVLIDAYEMTGEHLWRIDLGRNIRAGAHYTQFMVYDFDCDGKAEVAVKTAPGSIDGIGKYVTEAGNTDTIRNDDNSKVYINMDSSGKKKGHIFGGPEYLTIFNGETGAAMQTVDYVAKQGDVNSWGDDYSNRADRFVAAVAYLDGVKPSIIMGRGYYNRTVITAYDWDGKNLTVKWNKDTGTDKSDKFYGQGNHQLSVADLDNDGFDEIINGSAALDHDGTVLHSTGWGHGDALHVSDFNNDGKQEIFSVLEDNPTWGTGFRDGQSGTAKWKKTATFDVGRGVMDVMSTKHKNGVIGWSSQGIYDIDGNEIDFNSDSKYTPSFLIYWDGDLLRECLDKHYLTKWNDTRDGFDRLWTLSSENNVAYNNNTKGNPCLTADLFGDWREEIIMRHSDNSALRIFFSLTPTEYKIPTLMHDSQYRCAVAWQNTGYNQPPHTSFYIGPNKKDYPQPEIDVICPYSAEFTVTSVKGPLEGAEIWINGNMSAKTDSEGHAAVTAGAGDNAYQIVKSGYITAEGTFKLDNSNVNANILKRLETKMTTEVTVKFVTEDGTELKESKKETINGTFSVADDDKEDITKDGIVYEYSADLSSDNTAQEGADKTINLVFTKKTIENEVYKTNFSQNGFSAGSQNHGYQTSLTPSYGAVDKFRYGEYTIGDNNIEINLGEGLTNFVAEFDMAYIGNENAGGGSVFGITAFSGNSQGSTFGMRFTGQLVSQFAALWGSGKTNYAGNVSNKMLHYVLVCDGTSMYIKASDKSTGAVVGEAKANSLRNNVGSSGDGGKSVNKLKFMKADGSGNIKIGLGNFKVYKTDAPNVVEWGYGDNIFASIPSTTDIAPTKAVLQTGISDVALDMKDKLSYELVDSDNNTVSGGGISINENNQLVVAAGTANGTYTIKCMCGGNVVKTTTVTVADSGVAVEFKSDDGNTLKETKVITVNNGDTFTLDDSYKEDITVDGVVYEYNADKSDESSFTVNGVSTLSIVYNKKVVPGVYDTAIYNTNFSKDGFSSASEKHGYKAENPTYGEIDGFKYGKYSIGGDKTIEIDLGGNYTDFVAEFDMALINGSSAKGGNIYGIVPYSGNNGGTAFGFRYTGGLVPQFTVQTGNGGSTSGHKEASGVSVSNKMLHYVLVCDGTNMYISAADKATGAIVSSESILLNAGYLRGGVGSASAPVNKLKFMENYAASPSGEIEIALSNVLVYKIGGPTKATWPTKDEITVTVPSSTAIAPTEFVHESNIDGYSIDLLDKITYSIIDAGGNTVTPNGVSIADGKLVIAEGAWENVEYTVRCSYNGKTVKDIKFSTQKSSLTIKYRSAGGVALKEDETGVEYTSASAFDPGDARKDDIQKNGITYEYSPSLSDSAITSDSNGNAEYKLVFEEKRTFDSDIYRTYFADNGYSSNSASHGYQTSLTPEYGKDTAGNKYTGYVIGDKGVDITLPAENTNFAVEFDMSYDGNYTEGSPSDGSIFGITAYGKDGKAGNTAGFVTNGENTFFGITDTDKVKTEKIADKTVTAHWLVVFTGGGVNLTVTDKNTGRILQSKLSAGLINNVGSAANPINKISINRMGENASGNVKLILGDLRIYKSDSASIQKWNLSDSVSLLSPSTVSFKPVSFDALAWADGLYVDLSEGLDYKLTDKNGGAFSSEFFSIDNNGNLTVKANAPEAEFNVVCSYSGKEVKTFNAYTEKGTINVSYKTSDGVTLKENTSAGEYMNGSTFRLADSYKEDIQKDGVIYEYDADSSDSSSFVVNGDTNITLIFDKNTILSSGDTNIYKTNFSKDGFSSDSEKHGYKAENPTYGEIDGFKYGKYSIGGNKSIEIDLGGNYTDFVAEFDMALIDSGSAKGGNIYGIVPYSGNTGGTAFGFRYTGGLVPQFTVQTGNGGSSNGHKEASNVPQNKMLHYVLVCDGTNMYISAADKATGAIVSSESILLNAGYLRSGVGTASAPVNKLKFMENYVNTNSGEIEIALSDIMVYKIGGLSEGKFKVSNPNVYVTVPSKTDLSSAGITHKTGIENVEISLNGNMTYSITDKNGNAVSPSGITISSDGNLTVAETALSGNYNVICSYDGKEIKKYNVTVTERKLFEYEGDEGASLSYKDGSWGFVQKSTDGGRELKGDFPVVKTGKAELKFTFSTGGTQDSNDAWNWTGREYTHEIQLLDSDFDGTNPAEHILLAFSQEYLASGAQEVKYYTKGSSKSDIKNAANLINTDPNITARSATTWYVTVNFDFDAKKASFDLCDANGNGYRYTGIDISKGFKTMRIASSGNGNISWSPTVSNVTYSLTSEAKYDKVYNDRIVIESLADTSNAVSFSAFVKNEEFTEGKNAVVIAALYDADGFMIAMEHKSAVISKDVSQYDFEINKNGSVPTLMKIFVWDDLSSMKPIEGMAVFEKQLK